MSRSLEPNLTTDDRPSCSKGHGPMMLTDVTSEAGQEIRTFTCSVCQCVEKVALKTTA
jgi:hypothetical protein